MMRNLLIFFLLVGFLGCSSRPYSRLEIARVISPIAEKDIPKDGIRLQPLPPMPEAYGLKPDTDDGTVLIEIDQQQFFRDFGRTLPAWEPKRVLREETDRTVAATSTINENLRIVREILDRMLASGEDKSNKTGSEVGGIVGYALCAADWNGIQDRVISLSEIMEKTIGTLRDAPAALDGKSEVAKRLAAMWEGMDSKADMIVVAAARLTSSGGYNVVMKDPRYSKEFIEANARIVDGAKVLKDSVIGRSAPSIVTLVRQLQRRIDELEMTPGSQAVFSIANPMALTKEQRDATRSHLSWLRSRLVALAAHWAQKQADILSLPATTPEFVYSPISTFGQ